VGIKNRRKFEESGGLLTRYMSKGGKEKCKKERSVPVLGTEEDFFGLAKDQERCLVGVVVQKFRKYLDGLSRRGDRRMKAGKKGVHQDHSSHLQK